MSEKLVATVVYPTGAVVRVYGPDEWDKGRFEKLAVNAVDGAVTFSAEFRVEPVAPVYDRDKLTAALEASQREPLTLLEGQDYELRVPTIKYEDLLKMWNRCHTIPGGVPSEPTPPACTCPSLSLAAGGHEAGCPWANRPKA